MTHYHFGQPCELGGLNIHEYPAYTSPRITTQNNDVHCLSLACAANQKRYYERFVAEMNKFNPQCAA